MNGRADLIFIVVFPIVVTKTGRSFVSIESPLCTIYAETGVGQPLFLFFMVCFLNAKTNAMRLFQPVSPELLEVFYPGKQQFSVQPGQFRGQ